MIPLQVTKCYKPSVIDAVGSPPGRFTPASQADCGGFLVNEKRSNPFGSWVSSIHIIYTLLALIYYLEVCCNGFQKASQIQRLKDVSRIQF